MTQYSSRRLWEKVASAGQDSSDQVGPMALHDESSRRQTSRKAQAPTGTRDRAMPVVIGERLLQFGGRGADPLLFVIPLPG